MEHDAAIRPAVVSDLEGVVAADAHAQAHPERVASLERHIATDQCWVAEAGGRVLGYVVLEYNFFGNGIVSLLVVRSDSRRLGIGRALLEHAVSSCSTAKLFSSTNESNVAMRSLLRECGFKASGVIHNLDDGDPELIFFRRLRNP